MPSSRDKLTTPSLPFGFRTRLISPNTTGNFGCIEEFESETHEDGIESLICIRQLCRVAAVQFNSIRQSRLGKPPLTDLKHAGGEVNAAHAAFRTHGFGDLQQTVSRTEADLQDSFTTCYA